MEYDEFSAFVKRACEDLGLPPAQVISTDRFRWTIEPSTPDFYKYMLKLEAILQQRTGRPIDLRLESEEDKNKRKQRNVLTGR